MLHVPGYALAIAASVAVAWWCLLYRGARALLAWLL
jgi:hypothetical protein